MAACTTTTISMSEGVTWHAAMTRRRRNLTDDGAGLPKA
jgi:hypothetical protein